MANGIRRRTRRVGHSHNYGKMIQRPMKGGRDRVIVFLDPRVAAVLRRTQIMCPDAPLSFIADVALADRFGIKLEDADDYRRRNTNAKRR